MVAPRPAIDLLLLEGESIEQITPYQLLQFYDDLMGVAKIRFNMLLLTVHSIALLIYSGLEHILIFMVVKLRCLSL